MEGVVICLDMGSICDYTYLSKYLDRNGSRDETGRGNQHG